MTFIVQKEIEFDAGHRVHQHGGKCRNLHGHRYKVEVQIETQLLAQQGSATGMVLDFGEIKQWLVEDVEQVFDHKLILSIDDPLAEALLGPAKIYDARSSMWHGPWRMEFQGGDGIAIVLMKRTPTAENLARLISDLMEIRLELYDEHFVKCVRVWETPKSLAIWEA